jgi:hypothetical protein
MVREDRQLARGETLMFEYGQEGLFFIIRIIATIGGAVVGWFVCDPLTRAVYRLIYREAAPGILLFSFKAIGSTSLALAIYFWMPLGGGGGLGQGPGKGGLPGKGPGKGGDKANVTDASKKDEKNVADPKLDKSTPNGKTPPTRELVLIEIIGGERFPTDGKDRYYLLKKVDPPISINEIEDYFKEHRAKLEIKIIQTDNSTVINTDMDPTRRLLKLASKYDITSQVIGP